MAAIEEGERDHSNDGTTLPSTCVSSKAPTTRAAGIKMVEFTFGPYFFLSVWVIFPKVPCC
jgi:hypothetical protein